MVTPWTTVRKPVRERSAPSHDVGWGAGQALVAAQSGDLQQEAPADHLGCQSSDQLAGASQPQ